jgi:hypothetical protein
MSKAVPLTAGTKDGARRRLIHRRRSRGWFAATANTLTDTLTLSEDPQVVDKVRDVVGPYMHLPEHAVVMCVDAKTSIQAPDWTQPSLTDAARPDRDRTHDYARHGVTDLFAALNLATGQVLHHTRPPHRAIEFRKFLDLIDEPVPADLATGTSKARGVEAPAIGAPIG